jgi:hypothetical protein
MSETDGSDTPATVGADLHAQSDVDVAEQNTRLTFAASFDFHDGQAAANFEFAVSSDNGAVPSSGTITVTTSLEVDLLNASFAFKAELDPGVVPIEANSITAEHTTSPSAEPEPSQLLKTASNELYGSWELGMENSLHGLTDYHLI